MAVCPWEARFFWGLVWGFCCVSLPWVSSIAVAEGEVTLAGRELGFSVPWGGERLPQDHKGH